MHIDDISVGDRLRDMDAQQIAALAESIATVGLLNPITVTPAGELIAGAHRLAACKSLGMTDIAVTVVDLAEQERIIAEADENLIAPTLTPSDRAIFTAARKAAYETLYPESRKPGPKNNCGQLGHNSFAEDQAAKTGAKPRTIRRDAERGTRVTPEAMRLLRHSELDQGSYLDALKAVPAEEQEARVRADLTRLREVDKAMADRRQLLERNLTKMTQAEERARTLAEGKPPRILDALAEADVAALQLLAELDAQMPHAGRLDGVMRDALMTSRKRYGQMGLAIDALLAAVAKSAPGISA